MAEPVTITVELGPKWERLMAALVEVGTAWGALPDATRELLDGGSFTLHAYPPPEQVAPHSANLLTPERTPV